MSQPPRLVDREALSRNRARAASAPALFLHEAVAGEAQERLIEVNRTFTSAAVVTPWPGVWSAAMPEAKIVPDDEVLALEPETQDLVVHGLALHWANDPVGQIVQARRALRPDGLFLAACFGGRTLNELRTALAEAEVRVAGGLSPRVAPMGEVRELGGLLHRAGLALPVADVTPLRVTYRTPFHLMRDLRAMGEQNALSARPRGPTRRGVVEEAARVYAETYPAEDGRVAATFDIVWLTGWAPSENQQKPLRPGSAKARLADALGTEEHATGARAAPRRD